MKKIGFIMSKKENELRRALTFEDLNKLKNKQFLYFENGYFDSFGYTDDDIIELGANVLGFNDILRECDVIVDPKIGDSNDLNLMNNKTIFGWVHATQNYDITQSIIDNNITAIAFEKMFDGSKHLFYLNNQIAGYAAIFHSMLCCGKNYSGLDVAVIGNGNTSKGAVDALKKLGANITIYQKKDEEKFKKEMFKYDIIVNAILWDVNRKDHIIYKDNLKNLRKNAIIIDVSCDRNGGIETSIPTTIDNPIYIVDGITHYVVDHTPSFLYKDATKSISQVLVNYIDLLVSQDNLQTIFKDALIIENGIIKDKEIIEFQKRGI